MVLFPVQPKPDWLGECAFDRCKRTSVTDQMVDQLNLRKEFQLAVTPEGTRKRLRTKSQRTYPDGLFRLRKERGRF